MADGNGSCNAGKGRAADFSYKEGAFRCYYDIEALPNLFTVTFWNGRAATLWFFGSPDYDGVSDEELAGAFSSYLDDPYHRQTLGLAEGFSPDVNVMRVRQDDMRSMNRFRMQLARFATCHPMDSDLPYVGNDRSRFVEYVGWNSWNYDLPMMLFVLATMDSRRPSQGESGWKSIRRAAERSGYANVELPYTPNDIRRISDFVVSRSCQPARLCKEFVRFLAENDYWLFATERRVLELLYKAVWWDGHIDIAKMLRSTDDNSEQMFPPGLKKQEAMMGADIIADDAVGQSDPGFVMGKPELLDFVRYNLHDVACTAHVGETRDVRGRIFVRDTVRELFPYTSARSYPPFEYVDKSRIYPPPERDITEAQLTALSLVGERRARFTDYPRVSYEFPVPDASAPGGFAEVDLLDYMREREEFMPDDLYTFFDHWRHRDTREWSDFYQAKHDQPLTRDTAANIPYYRLDPETGGRVPIDAFIRVSTGGAHGSVMSGLSGMSPAEVAAWTRSNSKPAASRVPTLDITDVVHADFTSYYPYLMTKMGAFLANDGVDRYSAIYEERVRIKAELSRFRKDDWGPEQVAMNNQQNGLKLQLNSATGKANTRRKHSLLPLDNKIMSMRLIGNMSIWCLAQRMVNAGGYIVSTNTDGIYVANIDLGTAQEVVDGFVATYGILVDPETVNRFINRDVSNRMEFYHEQWPYDIRGLLRSARKLHFDDTEHGHSVKYPLAAGHAVVRYMAGDSRWLEKPYDRARMRKILEDIRSGDDLTGWVADDMDGAEREWLASEMGKFQSRAGAMSWVQVYASNQKNRLLFNGETTQKVDRVALTSDGGELAQEAHRKAPRATAHLVWQAVFEGGCKTFGEVAEATGLEIDPAFRGIGTDTLCMAKKIKGKGRRDADALVALPVPARGMDEAEFGEWWRGCGASCIAYSHGAPAEMHELKVWGRTQLSGYPHDPRGVLLDSADDLNRFDLSRLDMDAYLEWAESMLANWKVAARLTPQGTLEMLFPDDRLAGSPSPRGGKKERALAMIKSLYDSVVPADDKTAA